MDDKRKQQALRDVWGAAKAAKEYDRGLHLAVQIARDCGASWQDIGNVLGVTRQSAHERFGKKGEPDG